jgi:lysozyme
MIEQLRKDLIVDEGLKLFPYKCTANKLTIGVGRNLDDKKLSEAEINILIEARKHRYTGGDKFKFLLRDFADFGITKEEAFYLLDNDIEDFSDRLYPRLPWLSEKPDDVKRVLLNMAFNLGIVGLLKFKTTLGLIRDSKYEEASKQMLNSLWARQVKGRAIRLSNILKSVQDV